MNNSVRADRTEGGRSSAPLPRGMILPEINRKPKMDLCPSIPLKNEEQDKRQRRGLSPAKPINNFQGLEWE